jgi:hypothetical protein
MLTKGKKGGEFVLRSRLCRTHSDITQKVKKKFFGKTVYWLCPVEDYRVETLRNQECLFDDQIGAYPVRLSRYCAFFIY